MLPDRPLWRFFTDNVSQLKKIKTKLDLLFLLIMNILNDQPVFSHVAISFMTLDAVIDKMFDSVSLGFSFDITITHIKTP